MVEQLRAWCVLDEGRRSPEAIILETKALLIAYIAIDIYMLDNIITPVVDTQIRNVITELVPKYDLNCNGKLNVQELVGFLNEAMLRFGWSVKVT